MPTKAKERKNCTCGANKGDGGYKYLAHPTQPHVKVCRHCGVTQEVKAVASYETLLRRTQREQQPLPVGVEVPPPRVKVKNGCSCPSNKHVGFKFHAHPTLLQYKRCRHCGFTGEVPKLKNYLALRRRTRRELNLYTVSAPVEYSTAKHVLEPLCAKVGVVSNTYMLHLTFVDGLQRKSSQTDDQVLHGLFQALQEDNTFTITRVHAVDRREKATKLVLAEVHFGSDAVDAQVQKLVNSKDCVLPQFPIHLALGAVDEPQRYHALVVLGEQLANRTFSVDVNLLRMLQPMDPTIPIVPPPPPSAAASNGKLAPASSHIRFSR